MAQVKVKEEKKKEDAGEREHKGAAVGKATGDRAGRREGKRRRGSADLMSSPAPGRK